MSTLSGRLVWQCQNWEEQNDIANRVQRLLLQSWNANESVWTTNLLTVFQESTDPKIRNAIAGMIEFHWPTPSMPLETHAGVVFLFITVFTILPTAVIIIAATPLTNWQTPAASALLFGGQAILSTGHFLAQWVVKRQRRTVHLDIPRQDLSDSWMLVDNTWFTSTLARRRLFHNPLSPHAVTIGQHVVMKEHIPTWEALITLVTIAIGFLAFYIGARSSHLWVILFEIVSHGRLDILIPTEECTGILLHREFVQRVYHYDCQRGICDIPQQSWVRRRRHTTSREACFLESNFGCTIFTVIILPAETAKSRCRAPRHELVYFLPRRETASTC